MTKTFTTPVTPLEFNGSARPLLFQLPRHQTYVETRGSVGAKLFAKPRSRVEVLNDRDGAAVNLSRVLINQETRLRVLTRYAASLNSHRIVAFEGDDAIARAAQFALEIVRATSKMPASSYRIPRRFPIELERRLQPLDHALDRLRKVQLEDHSSLDLLGRYDWSQAFFLCDERTTTWESDDGCALAKQLNTVRGKVALIVDERPDWISKAPRWKQMTNADKTWVNY